MDHKIIFTKLVDSIIHTGAFDLVAGAQSLLVQMPIEVRAYGSEKLARLHSLQLLRDVLAHQEEVQSDKLRAAKLCAIVADTHIPDELERMLLPVMIDLDSESPYTTGKTQNLSSKDAALWFMQRDLAVAAQLSDTYDVVLPNRERSLFNLPLPWSKMFEIWRRFIRMQHDATLLNLLYLDQFEHERPNASVILADKQRFNISCFGRYPTKLLVAMIDGINSDLSKVGPIFAVNEDYNGFTYDVGQKLDAVAQTCLDEQVIPMVYELEGMYDLFKRIVAIRKETRKGKKTAFSLIISHGSTWGISVGNLEFLTPKHFISPPHHEEDEIFNESGMTKKAMFDRVQAIVKQLQLDVFEPDTPMAVITCDQGEKDGLADVLSQVFSTRVWGGIGYVAVKSIKLLKDTDGKFSFSVVLDKTSLVANYASGRLIKS